MTARLDSTVVPGPALSGDVPGDLRFGFVATSAASQRVDRGVVGDLEALGCASLWAPGHVTTGRPVPEAVTGVAGLAALAERAVVGTAVLLLPLYHPVIVAKQFAEIDRMAGGRAVLGIGVGGEYTSEFEACGVPVTERGQRADEAIDVLRALWRGAPVDHDGRFFSLRGTEVAPAPVRAGGPPIIVGGRKLPSMRRAAVRGDGWMPFLYSPGQYRDSVLAIEEHAASVGRDLAHFEWMCFLYVCVDDDPERARQQAVSYIGAGQAGDGTRFEGLVDRIAATGTPEQVAERIRAFADAGARHFIVAACDPTGPVPTAARLLEDVMPRLLATSGDR